MATEAIEQQPETVAEPRVVMYGKDFVPSIHGAICLGGRRSVQELESHQFWGRICPISEDRHEVG